MAAQAAVAGAGQAEAVALESLKTATVRATVVVAVVIITGLVVAKDRTDQQERPVERKLGLLALQAPAVVIPAETPVRCRSRLDQAGPVALAERLARRSRKVALLSPRLVAAHITGQQADV